MSPGHQKYPKAEGTTLLCNPETRNWKPWGIFSHSYRIRRVRRWGWWAKLARGHKAHMGHHCFLSWCTGAKNSLGSPRPSLLPFRENFPGFRFFSESCTTEAPDKCCQLKSQWEETSWVWTAWDTHSLYLSWDCCGNLRGKCRKQAALSPRTGASPQPVPVMVQEDMKKKSFYLFLVPSGSSSII